MLTRIPLWLRRLLWPGVFLFLVPGAFLAYFLMPFPGSQEPDVMTLCYGLHRWIIPIRIVGVLMMLPGLLVGFAIGGLWRRIGYSFLVVLSGVVSYLTSIDMTAEQIFREPRSVAFADAITNRVPVNALVLGVESNGAAKAYPIRYLAYHHKIIDTLAGQPIMPTYCSMCRSGRVFIPVVDGRVQRFRLVGARMYNAMIEDVETKSWWYQESGEAVAGPRTGTRLLEMHSEEMPLSAWLVRHPSSLVFQPDTASGEGYEMFSRWDSVRPPRAAFDSSASAWKPRNWVLGVLVGDAARAYGWTAIVKAGVKNDTIDGAPVLVGVESDSITFHGWSRDVNGTTLTFTSDTAAHLLRDAETQSTWNWSGQCVAGPLTGQHLGHLRAFREYWHSWITFHPRTTRWAM